MLTDANKGITNITYNHLNLPGTVIFSGTNKKIDYFYDAVGTKLKKVVTDASSLITSEYAGNFVYENGVLQFFNTAEGYVEPKGLGWEYVYQYKDHLGNVRLSYADSNGDGVITATGTGAEIREENNYYPFGLKHKGYNSTLTGKDHKYGFGNKEEQDELGLGWIDITARNYDPALGRWMNLDPLAELMRRHSPYNYAFDNPVYFIDPDGNLPQSGRQETDATRSQREQLDAQKKQEDVQKALGFLVDKGVIKNNSSSGTTGGDAKVGTVEGEQGTFGAPISEDGGGGEVASSGETSSPPTTFINEEGKVIAETDDGSDNIYVIDNEKSNDFLSNLLNNSFLHKDNNKEVNDELGLRYRSYKFSGVFDFTSIGNCRLCLRETSIGGVKKWWEWLGYQPGGSNEDLVNAASSLATHSLHNDGPFWEFTPYRIEASKEAGNPIFFGYTTIYLGNFKK